MAKSILCYPADHVLKVPEGYEKNEEEFNALDTFCDVSVVLQKQN